MNSYKRRFARSVIHFFLFFVALIFMFPFYWLFVSAFKAKEQIFTLPPQLVPNPWQFENMKNVFNQTNIIRAFCNSTIIAVGYCLLALFLCSLGGYAFAKYPKAPAHKKLFIFVLGTMMIPGAVTLIPVFVVLCKMQLVNTYWALIIPGAANAFGIFWMRQYMANNLNDSLIDAARIDGCNEFGIYWRIALPLARPALAALGVMFLIGIWNNLMWALIVLRTEDMYTLPLIIFMLHGELRTPYGLIMAGGLIATMPLVIAFLFFQKHFIQGIMAGSLKA